METKQRKKQKMKRLKMKRRKMRMIFIGSILTIVAFAGCTRSVTNSKAEQGREHLVQMEQMDLVSVEDKIQKHHKKVDLDSIESGDFKTIYEDTVFMGDSITESLAFNEILDEYKVIAHMGDTVRDAMKRIPTLEGLQPRNVVLLYGMNDVILFEETAEWGSIDKFKDAYKTLIEEIKNRLPNTNIYVQSPLPVTDKAISTNPRLTNDNLTRFREAVKQVCEETGVTYVDISVLAQDTGLHEADGIHFKKEFYEKWLGYLRGFMNK